MAEGRVRSREARLGLMLFIVLGDIQVRVRSLSKNHCGRSAVIAREGTGI